MSAFFLIFAIMYKVRLPNFEGPLDLLLFFIRRDELDIYDIPIAEITNKFLEYVRLMKLLDLELAGEFLVVAAMLMQIKAKMLLPKEEGAEEEQDDEFDPRTELVQRLLEYKRYKEVSEHMGTMSENERYVYYRQFFKGDVVKRDEDEELANVTLFDLIAAFKRALDNAPRKTVHEVVKPVASIEDRAGVVLARLEEQGETTFFEVVKDVERIVVVVTFLALLELIRGRRIAIKQSDHFEDILIYRP